MKKYTHPKKNTNIIVSKNGATNTNLLYNNVQFVSTSFDLRCDIEQSIELAESTTNLKNLTFINEYKYTTKIMWINFQVENNT